MFKKARENKKGFTLAELLIVVAIIAVLVAISIPIFTSQLEKSREATDMANIRALYAEAVAEALTNDGTEVTKTYTAKQAQSNWQTDSVVIAKVDFKADTANGLSDIKGKTVTIKAKDDGTVSFTAA